MTLQRGQQLRLLPGRLVFLKEICIDPLHFIERCACDAHVVVEHVLRELCAVDERDFGSDGFNVGSCFPAEC